MPLFIKKISEFLVGFLLIPWIWVWGYLLVDLVFLFFFRSMINFEEIDLGIRQTLVQNFSITNFTIIFSSFIFINYTISFCLKKKYPNLENLIFLSSCFLLFLLVLLSWPYFREVLAGS